MYGLVQDGSTAAGASRAGVDTVGAAVARRVVGQLGDDGVLVRFERDERLGRDVRRVLGRDLLAEGVVVEGGCCDGVLVVAACLFAGGGFYLGDFSGAAKDQQDRFPE